MTIPRTALDFLIIRFLPSLRVPVRRGLTRRWEKRSTAFHGYTHESVHPEPVEGWPPRSWFDKPVLSLVEGLTTNGYVTVIVQRTTKPVSE